MSSKKTKIIVFLFWHNKKHKMFNINFNIFNIQWGDRWVISVSEAVCFLDPGNPKRLVSGNFYI